MARLIERKLKVKAGTLNQYALGGDYLRVVSSKEPLSFEVDGGQSYFTLNAGEEVFLGEFTNVAIKSNVVADVDLVLIVGQGVRFNSSKVAGEVVTDDYAKVKSLVDSNSVISLYTSNHLRAANQRGYGYGFTAYNALDVYIKSIEFFGVSSAFDVTCFAVPNNLIGTSLNGLPSNGLPGAFNHTQFPNLGLKYFNFVNAPVVVPSVMDCCGWVNDAFFNMENYLASTANQKLNMSFFPNQRNLVEFEFPLKVNNQTFLMVDNLGGAVANVFVKFELLI